MAEDAPPPAQVPAPEGLPLEELDPTTTHHSLGMLALVGVVLLVLVGAAQTYRIAGNLRAPPPPEVVALRDLVERAVRHHFRPAPGRLAADLPAEVAALGEAFPELGFVPSLPASWPGEGRRFEGAALVRDPDGPALQLRYRGGDGANVSALLARPPPSGVPAGSAELVRAGVRVRVESTPAQVALLVEPVLPHGVTRGPAPSPGPARPPSR